MKVSVLAVAAALAGSVIGQGVPGLPKCAQSCVVQFTSGSSIGGCAGLDTKCICSSSSFLSDIACCLAGVCSPDDQVAATNYAKTICKTGGVTNLPDAVSCATGTAAQTASTGSSSSTASSVVPAQTSSAQTTTTVSSPSSAPSTASSTVSSGSNASSSSAAAQTTSSAASTASAANASSSPGPTSTPNAGQQNVAGMGAGILGGLAAAVALL
ncbi:hypothetical protein F5884DRAFT_817464 [Xylogone sp. PMI_703]|nr:hypothetical protein F5884DRAFT_817464 [Xylogone sp. PMI_703]